MTRATVLVVDDAPAVAASQASALRAAFRVEVATSVADALDVVATDPPAAVVLDLALDRPASALHRALELERIPVLVVSGLDTDEARALAAAKGWRCAPGGKPVRDEDLREMVGELLAGRDRASAAPPPPAAPAPVQSPAAASGDAPTLPAPPGTPEALDRTASGSPMAHDPGRDRLRVALDRLLYLAVIVSIVVLKLKHELDVETGALLLVVAGIRPHNLFQLATAARSGGARATVGMMVATAAASIQSGAVFAR